MSPFIVTHYRNGPWPHTTAMRDVLYREAFATLEEARESARRIYRPFDHPDGRDVNQRCLFLDGTPHHIPPLRATGWRNIGESGGSALLPNGDVIEVEATTRKALIEALLMDEKHLPSRDWPWTTEQLCAAWNAGHEGVGLEHEACSACENAPATTPEPLRESILGVLVERASVYPDDSRPVYADEIAEALGLSDLEAGRHGRVPASLRVLAKRGLAWRLPGPGTAGWIVGERHRGNGIGIRGERA